MAKKNTTATIIATAATLLLLLSGCGSAKNVSVTDPELVETSTVNTDNENTINAVPSEPQISKYSDNYVSFDYDSSLFEVEVSDDKMTISITCPSMPNEPDGSHNTIMGITTQPNQYISEIAESDIRASLETLSETICKNLFELYEDESIIADGSKYSDCCAEYTMEVSDGSQCYAKSINYNSYITTVVLRLCDYSKNYNDNFMDIYDSIRSEFGNYDFSAQPNENVDTKENPAVDTPLTSDEETSASVETTGQKNALSKAKQYLNYSSFSYSGLIEQLEYEKFSHEEAVYAADNCGANWNEQALAKAESYLDFSAFSYKGLVEQLKYEKYTDEQATYAVDNCNADWNEQAALKAESYLSFSSFSRNGLIDQLEYEGFTHEQAIYGVEANGF